MAKSGFDELARWADRAAVNLLYKGRAKAAEQVISDLQELGPQWSGRFSNSWRISTPTGSQSGGSGSEKAPVPVSAPDLTGADVRTKLLGSPFKIDNVAPYADIACDLEEGEFEDPGIAPLKEPSYGDRKTGRRGEPYPNPGARGLKGRNRATAPLDWFVTYVDGGALDKAVENAMKKQERGFK
jgi:hypothetical protein